MTSVSPIAWRDIFGEQEGGRGKGTGEGSNPAFFPPNSRKGGKGGEKNGKKRKKISQSLHCYRTVVEGEPDH